MAILRETLDDGVVQVLEGVDADGQQQEQDETEREAEDAARVHRLQTLSFLLFGLFDDFGVHQLAHHADPLFDLIGRLGRGWFAIHVALLVLLLVAFVICSKMFPLLFQEQQLFH